jgi:hypothetical protein
MNPLEIKNPKAPLARKSMAHRFIGGLKKLESTLALTPARSPRRGRIVRRLPVRVSSFGLLSDFDIRISDFLS